MSRGRAAIAAVVAFVVLVAVGEIVLNTRGSGDVLGIDDVEAAFAAERLDVTTVRFDDEGTVMAPPDGSFTVVVLPSVGAAERSLEPYVADDDPTIYAQRVANVLVVADETNDDEPLADEVRTRIQRALDGLAGSA